MIKKIAGFFSSIKFRVFFVLSVVAVAVSIIVGLIVFKTSFSEALNAKESGINSYISELNDKIKINSYLLNPSESDKLSQEIRSVSLYLDGRVIIFDSRLKIIADTYSTEIGKTLISPEAVSALKGSDNREIDYAKKCIKLTKALKGEKVDNKEEITGGIIFVFSIESEMNAAENLRKSILFVELILIPLILIFGIIFSVYISKPFKKVTYSVKRISDGYMSDNVDFSGYTEVEDISNAFNEMLSKLSKMEESRQEFVSNVSHELKTPITSIKVLAETLLAQPDAPEEMRQEFLSDINDEIDRENQIIVDLLALVKLDRKNGDMHIAEVSINELLEIILKRLRPIASAKNVDLYSEMRRDVMAEVDGVKLSLAITNLIENAIKYNANAGKVSVGLDCDHKSFTITVKDTGIGIPKESQERIFDRFYRVDKTRARETGGTGLGLSITKSVVLMHKGQISVESKEGEGSVFTMKIPMNFIPETET